MVHQPAPDVPGYTLGEWLGAGGSGTVWAATRDLDGTAVAVKVVPCGPDSRAAARELAVLAGVPVDGVLRLHEAVGLVGEPPVVALVLDRAEGGSLQRALDGRGHLSVGESVTVLAPVARALAGLHASGVVHGDVSPANVLLERSGRPLLADLGVARLVAEAADGDGEVEVTPELAAPEVLSRGLVTPASDVYAAGALAWWCVTGAAPAPLPLRPELTQVAGWLPPAWRDATLAALSPDPADRPSAADLALAWFDSAPCEPLRLVVGEDETALLTQRLRHGAPPADEPVAVPARRWSAWLVRWGQLVRSAAARLGWLVRRVRQRDVLLGAAALSVAVAAVVAGPELRSPAATGATPAATGATPAAAPAPPAPSPPGTSTSAAGPATSRRAPVEDPLGLMQALADLRARAVVTGSRSDLSLLDAPGSPALAADTAALAELARSRVRWAGVRLTVRRALAAAPAADGAVVDGVDAVDAVEEAVVDAVVDTAAYRVVDAGGGEVVAPAVAGQPMRFHLRWVGGRWRVHAVAARHPAP
jgi:hypothetical protein